MLDVISCNLFVGIAFDPVRSVCNGVGLCMTDDTALYGACEVAFDCVSGNDLRICARRCADDAADVGCAADGRVVGKHIVDGDICGFDKADDTADVVDTACRHVASCVVGVARPRRNVAADDADSAADAARFGDDRAGARAAHRERSVCLEVRVLNADTDILKLVFVFERIGYAEIAHRSADCRVCARNGEIVGFVDELSVFYVARNDAD